MHATVQPNGRSPKRVNGPSSQLKSSSNCIQNSSSSFLPQTKGKRKERADQISESVKRERLSKMDDTDSVQGRSESFLKHEIIKITEKGGLVDIDEVETFVHLMFPERGEKKVDLACRLLLASVIASTEKSECLNQFVRLKGLSVLDEWLQEVHKGKVGDGVSPRANDKAVEEFISVSLRALEKLPVNLHALQTCNIRKSVNHLRSHKNSEIQKKARTLVDTWKKRVEAETKINYAVPWSARSRLPDVAQGGRIQHQFESVSRDIPTQSTNNQSSSVNRAGSGVESLLTEPSDQEDMLDAILQSVGKNIASSLSNMARAIVESAKILANKTSAPYVCSEKLFTSLQALDLSQEYLIECYDFLTEHEAAANEFLGVSQRFRKDMLTRIIHAASLSK